jgi:hypothetical protein
MKVEAARHLTYAAAGLSHRGGTNPTYFGAAAKCFASGPMQVTTDRCSMATAAPGIPGRADDA